MSDVIPAIRETPPPPRYTPYPGVAVVPDDATSLASRFRFGTVVRILRRRLWLVLAITSALGAATVALVRREEPVYRAAGMIRIADVRRAMTGGIDDAPSTEVGPSTIIDPLQSQLTLLQGRTLIGEVVRREQLRVVTKPGALRAYLDSVRIDAPDEATAIVALAFDSDGVVATVGRATRRARYGVPLSIGGVTFTVRRQPPRSRARLTLMPTELAIDAVLHNLKPEIRDHTDAIRVEYTTDDPGLARRVVNTLIAEFQVANVATAQQRSRRRATFLEDQLHNTDSSLADAQAALSAFRSQARIYSPRERGTAEQQSMLTVSVQREQMEADRRTLQRLLASVATASGAERRRLLGIIVSSPSVAGNAVVAQLNNQLSAYVTTRDSLTSGTLAMAVTHPDVQRLDAQIASAEARLIDATQSQAVALASRIAALDAVRARGAAELQRLPAAEVEEVRLTQRAETFGKLADQLRDELQRTRIAEAVEVGQVEVVYWAPQPLKPAGTGGAFKVALGVLLGMLIAGGVALVLELGSGAIRDPSELEAVLHVPRFALIPRIDSAGHRSGAQRFLPRRRGWAGAEPVAGLVTATNAQSQAAQAYRVLRTNIAFAAEGPHMRVMAVTSATSGEGKTTVASNLAVAFAQQGRRTLLIDGDLHRARLHRLFATARAPGVTDLLQGRVLAVDAIHDTGVPGLSLMPGGGVVDHPADLLSTGRTREALSALRERFDVIVIDTPPVLATPDASIIAGLADGVLLVVRAGATETHAVRRASEQLALVGTPVLGSVLNDPDSQTPRDDQYEYYTADRRA